MRISDWSSDVCSSDLRRHVASNHHLDCLGFGVLHRDLLTRLVAAVAELLVQRPLGTGGHVERLAEGDAGLFAFRGVADGIGTRSEEHTSELQSLMRISYAVFCSKKKKLTLMHTHP